MKKLVLTLLITLFLGSCATVKNKLSDTEVKSIKKVGLISVIPNDSNIHHVGVTMFNNAYNTFRLESISPNKIAYQSAYDSLRSNNIEVLGLKTKNDLISKAYKNSYSSPKKEDIEKELLNIANSADVNYMVVIYSNPVQDRIGNSAEFNSGFGIFKRVTGAPHIYSTLAVDIIQTKPFTRLASSSYFSFNQLNSTLWHSEYEDSHDNYVEIPDKDKGTISTSLNHAITESVKYALLYSGLTL